MKFNLDTIQKVQSFFFQKLQTLFNEETLLKMKLNKMKTADSKKRQK